MEVSRINAKVIQPNEWVNSLVVVEKPHGQLWICLDLRDPNKAITMISLPTSLPTLEDTFAKMNGVKCFAKLDAKSECWLMKLEEELSYLTTFNTCLADTGPCPRQVPMENG